MSIQELGSLTGTPPEVHDLTKVSDPSNDSRVVGKEVSSPLKSKAGSRRLISTIEGDVKNCDTDGFAKYTPGTNSGSKEFDMSHPGIPLPSDPTLYSSTDRVERSFSREPGSELERALQSLERKEIEIHSKRKKEQFKKDEDLIQVSKDSPNLKRSHSEAITRHRYTPKTERYKEKRSSTRDLRRSKSNALVAKPKSKFTLINEKLGQSSLPHLGADTRAFNGKVFGFLFFTGKTENAANAKVQKDGKKGKKDLKETMGMPTGKNRKDSKKSSEKNLKEKRTKKDREKKTPKKSGGTHRVRSDRSRPRKSESHGRKNSKRASSRDMETLCQFEISPDEKVSGLVVKVRGKRS